MLKISIVFGHLLGCFDGTVLGEVSNFTTVGTALTIERLGINSYHTTLVFVQVTQPHVLLYNWSFLTVNNFQLFETFSL